MATYVRGMYRSRITPYLYLDVDGVLNACPPLPGVEIFYFDHQGRRFPICIPPGTKERLDRLAESFEMVWATTWREHAHPTLAARLDLGEDEWERIEFFGDYKLPAIISHSMDIKMSGTILNPWLWIDDRGEKEMAALGIRCDDRQTKVITPELGVGLTDEHVEQALAFAERVNAVHS